MKNYIITCCSTVDLSAEVLKQRNIPYASFSFIIDGNNYKDNFGLSYPLDKFYSDIARGMKVTTSQVSVDEYKELFEAYLSKDINVLHITLSSGISGTVNSANIAADELNEKYRAQVKVIDSLCCSSGYGMLVMMAKDKQEEGLSFEENVEWLLNNRQFINHWFFSCDLSSYIAGGRLSPFAGAIGTALKICPIMTVSKEGHLEKWELNRTKKNAVRKVVSIMEKCCDEGLDYDNYCYICHSAALDTAEEIRSLILQRFKNIREVNIYSVGSVIGAHTGPGTLALFFKGKDRPL